MPKQYLLILFSEFDIKLDLYDIKTGEWVSTVIWPVVEVIFAIQEALMHLTQELLPQQGFLFCSGLPLRLSGFLTL